MGSNPTAALLLIVLLAGFRFGGEQIKEAIMNTRDRKSNSKACVAKRCNRRLGSVITHLVETIWAIGARNLLKNVWPELSASDFGDAQVSTECCRSLLGASWRGMFFDRIGRKEYFNKFLVELRRWLSPPPPIGGTRSAPASDCCAHPGLIFWVKPI